MKIAVACGKRRRIALGLVAPAALIVAGGGTALAAAGPAAARAQAATSCTVHWAGKVFPPEWTTAKNWSTGKVPGPTDDVCIGTGVDVLTSVPISVHSLSLGPDAGIAIQGTASKPLTATVATSVDLTGPVSRMDLTDATVSAAQINDQGGGTIFTDGTCKLASPDITFGQGGGVAAAGGTTTLGSLPQLTNGTLSGVTLDAASAFLMVPGDIGHLVAANVSVGANSAILDPAGHNALTGLTSIDAQSSLTADSPLSLAHSFAASGNVNLGTTTLTVAGTYTQAQGLLAFDGAPALSASQVTIDQGASFQGGQSTITGNLVNNGFTDTFGTGHTQVTGSYTQGPAATLESGVSGGLLQVAGQATLAGAIDSAEVIPVTGTSVPVITFGSRSGNFTGHGLGITPLTKAQQIDAIITPQIAAPATAVTPGHQVTVDGASFGLGENVSIFLDHVAGTPLATAVGRYAGRFATQVTVPAGATAGQHTLIAVGSNGNRAQTTITVG